MIATRTRSRISAYRPPVAPIGARVLINITVRWLSHGLNGSYEHVVDYCGHRFVLNSRDLVRIICKAENLMQVQPTAIIVNHDGIVGYVVRVAGVQIRIHEQQIARVVESEATR